VGTTADWGAGARRANRTGTAASSTKRNVWRESVRGLHSPERSVITFFVLTANTGEFWPGSTDDGIDAASKYNRST
jgi:hypothetical protein